MQFLTALPAPARHTNCSKHPRSVYWLVKGNMYLTGGTSASELTFDGLQEQSYDFSYGRRKFDPPNFHWDHRALRVRR